MIALCILLGMFGAGAVTYLRSPRYSATALLLLPPVSNDQTGQPTRNPETQVQIATSTDVLGPAAAKMLLSIGQLRHQISVSAPTPDILKFVGNANTPQSAMAIANTVANYYRSTVAATTTQQNEAAVKTIQTQVNALRRLIANTPAKAQGDLTQQLLTAENQLAQAQVCSECSPNAFKTIEPATSASSDIVRTTTRNLATGALVGFLIAVAYLLMRETRGERLVQQIEVEAPSPRDQIAAATAAGAPEVASIVAQRPRTVDDWHTLFAHYQPSADERWSLRRVLRGLLAAEARPPAHVCIMTLSQDIDAVAIAPQLAAFAAGAGVRTLLVVIGRDPAVTALRQACRETALSHEPARPNLWIVDGKVDDADWPSVQLIVTSIVGEQPRDVSDRPSSTLLAISALAATPERIRTAAAAAAAERHPWAGVIVANPEVGDGTARRVADAS